MRDEVIQMVTDKDWSNDTCRRVIELGKGKVSLDECLSKVESANTRCLKFAKSTVPTVTSEDQGKFLVGILMTCPMADVLDIGYIVKGGKIHIQWSELDK